jgi:hypothetical protein
MNAEPVDFILRGFKLTHPDGNAGLSGSPHPYSVRKILAFLSLRGWLSCKIMITNKFHAESSNERSYEKFRSLLAASG